MLAIGQGKHLTLRGLPIFKPSNHPAANGGLLS